MGHQHIIFMFMALIVNLLICNMIIDCKIRVETKTVEG